MLEPYVQRIEDCLAIIRPIVRTAHVVGGFPEDETDEGPLTLGLTQ